MDEQDISYALAKQVPDMRNRGFIIGTAYGEINVPPGLLAERISKAVCSVFERELAHLHARAKA
jgi:predicted SprT family Zn-dependent metalloprotease